MKGKPVHHRQRQDVVEGKLLGPRMVIGSTLIDGPDPIWPNSVAVSTEAETRQAVQGAEQRVDFVKAYSLLSRAAFFALADEVRKRDIVFAGHVPDAVNRSRGLRCRSAKHRAPQRRHRGHLDPRSRDPRRAGTAP